ncbi:CDP-glucose 4,6-dehydratase [Desulfuribacillus stibiiarsenatis]|uniref:CDP-glucose 4,6-dehydratase n=1 Tax=Desulfuribacillus stibiiarsenatis TaxID=1390249 RepID=A0A1E5L5T8_9FIRM|nr:CDP-glucose 4,6-dehydratase [Desulfuribacillus stibiiarsenatis]OEH85507.1 CDP-glucose 4,6-dehydratase [Desulfuribacillus stibiiarsenatis]
MLTDISGFYKNKKVLVTGHTGFKGSWLALWLHTMGAEVLGYALPPERNNDHFCLLNLGKNIRHVEGDIRDVDQLESVFNGFLPEIVFHLAAQPIVKRSYQEPRLTFETNVMGSISVLEAVKNCQSVRSLVYITSDKCYKNKEWVWGYRENDELGGSDPYSASKAAAELVFASYKDSFLSKRDTLGLASTRAGNVIGGGDWSQDRIVPDTIRAITENIPVTLRSPMATRPWQHVLEPLSGYLVLAKKLYERPTTYSGSYNFGPNSESVYTVQSLVEEIIMYWGSGMLEIDTNQQRYHEATLLQLYSEKARQLLGWSAKWDFATTVKETTLWYKAITEGMDATKVSISQIEKYMEVMS